jgi:hypothetical protein
MYVRPSAWNNLAPTGRIFIKFNIWVFFRKSAEKIQLSFKSDMKTYIHLWQYLAVSFLQWELFQTKVVEKIKTHILCSIIFSWKSCRLWDNVKNYGRARQATDGNIIRRMCFACRIIQATDTHSKHVITTYCFSTAKTVTRTRHDITFTRTYV